MQLHNTSCILHNFDILIYSYYISYINKKNWFNKNSLRIFRKASDTKLFTTSALINFDIIMF